MSDKTLREAAAMALKALTGATYDLSTITGQKLGNAEDALRAALAADAPEGPFVVCPSVKPITGADWKVIADDQPGVFYGPKESCEYVRDALNRLHAQQQEG